MADRGQSQVVGYVLVLAIILLTVGILTATGHGGLQDAREFERTNNAQRAMVVFADNVDDVTTRGAPSRSTEVKLADGTLGFGSPVTVSVEVTPVEGPGATVSESFTVHPIVYRLDGARLVYLGGAVVREESGGAVMVREPAIAMDDQATLLPIVETYPGGDHAVGGDARSLVRAERTDRTVVRSSPGAHEVTLNVTTPRSEVWYRYLRSQPGTNCSMTGNTVSCTATSDRVTVTATRVRTTFS